MTYRNEKTTFICRKNDAVKTLTFFFRHSGKMTDTKKQVGDKHASYSR